MLMQVLPYFLCTILALGLLNLDLHPPFILPSRHFPIFPFSHSPILPSSRPILIGGLSMHTLPTHTSKIPILDWPGQLRSHLECRIGKGRVSNSSPMGGRNRSKEEYERFINRITSIWCVGLVSISLKSGRYTSNPRCQGHLVDLPGILGACTASRSLGIAYISTVQCCSVCTP